MQVFYIDDDADDREVFAEALNSIDKSIVYLNAESGKDAFNMLTAATSLPDIIFVDVNMPTMNGTQFLYEIKNNPLLRHIPVIMYSTSSRPQDIQEYMNLGARQFLMKPGSFHDLCDVLRRILTTLPGDVALQS